MLPDKFKEDRFERSSAPSKNNQCLVSHCRPSVQIMYMSIQKPLLQAVHVQCIWGTICNMKMEHQRRPEMPLILGRYGTQYVAIVTKLLSSNCGAHLVESSCKESNIYDTNWSRYPFSSFLIKIRLSVWRHHLANLYILKTWISLEPKEISENSKQHFFSSCRLLVYNLKWLR